MTVHLFTPTDLARISNILYTITPYLSTQIPKHRQQIGALFLVYIRLKAYFGDFQEKSERWRVGLMEVSLNEQLQKYIFDFEREYINEINIDWVTGDIEYFIEQISRLLSNLTG